MGEAISLKGLRRTLAAATLLAASIGLAQAQGVRIDDLGSIPSIDGSESMFCSQDGTPYRCAPAQIATYLQGIIGGWPLTWTARATFAVAPVYTATTGFGNSVVNPGTGYLESVLPVQTITGASYSFSTTDLFKKTRRSNAGAAMADTFPAATTLGIVNGARIIVSNTDATASITITAGAGTSMPSGSTDVIGPGRDVAYEYDAASATWRGAFNTRTALLSGGDVAIGANGATQVNKIQGTAVSTPTGSGAVVLAQSPALTGTPTAPTQTTGDNTTKIATDQFVSSAVANAAAGAIPAPQGRLTLTNGSPVMTSNVSAAGTVFYAPYAGSSIPLWNGTAFVPNSVRATQQCPRQLVDRQRRAGGCCRVSSL